MSSLESSRASVAGERAIPVPEALRSPTAQRVLRIGSRLGMLWVLVALVVAAQAVYPGFLDGGNLENLLSQNAQIGIIAVGMTFVMITGGFDLSVGAIYAGGAVFYADMASRMPLGAALLLTVMVGLALGAINGAIITRLRVNPFVATLGTGSVFGGAAFLYSDSAPILVDKPGFDFLGQGTVLGLPTSIWLLIAAFVVGGVVLARSVYGRSLYAIGGNNEAARLAGLRVDALRASTYVLVGACAAVGGAIISSRLGGGQADVGSTVALDAIAVVVIGGTSLFGGEGAVWRSAIGLGIIAVITNVSNSEGWDVSIQSVIKGFIVVAAVALDAYFRGRRA